MWLLSKIGQPQNGAGPGKGKHGRFNRSDSWWFNFDPQPCIALLLEEQTTLPQGVDTFLEGDRVPHYVWKRVPEKRL